MARVLHTPAQLVAVLPALALCFGLTGTVEAGNNNFRNNAVGGIAVNAEGLLDNAEVKDQLGLARGIAQDFQENIPADVLEASNLRKVSLRRLVETLAEAKQQARAIPDECKYLGGLLAIQYVFVYPEQNDIILAGPAEGWQVDRAGNVVGRTSGKPVLLLDDLLVALRSANGTRGGMSVSIDPTQQGLQQAQQLAAGLKSIGNPAQTVAALERALGQQDISINRLPKDSHIARVLVAADYKMKRLAMGMDQSPVRGLPSFLQMAGASGRGLQNMMPRWWLVPEYASISRDAEGLSWEFAGGTVKCMTESDFLDANGGRQQGVAVDATAQRWADAMSKNYEALSKAAPVFGELKAVIDLSLVGTLIAKERLDERAGLSLGLLMDADQLAHEDYFVPRQVASKATLMKKGRNWIISVSGGVKADPWGLVSSSQENAQLASMRSSMQPTISNRIWFD